MIYLDKIKGFEWDKGNLDKSYEKHGITASESEETFLDENLKVIKDIGHSQDEERFVAIGATLASKILFVVFTVRNDKVRIISARLANRKEREKYEKTI